MDRAASTVRRSGVRLMNIGGGHGALKMLISELNNVKSHSKAYMTSQNSAAEYLTKWAAAEDNRAVQDVSSQVSELNQVWTEAQREFIEELKEFKLTFDLILEGEKHVDAARNNLALCEQREAKIKKEIKKMVKMRTTAEEIFALEKRLVQAERQKDLAQLEVEDRIRENEANKLIRYKGGLLKLSNAYVLLSRKCGFIHEAMNNIAHELPDVESKDPEDFKYTGSGVTKQYVLEAKENIRQYKNKRTPDEPPPPYTPGDFYEKKRYIDEDKSPLQIENDRSNDSFHMPSYPPEAFPINNELNSNHNIYSRNRSSLPETHQRLMHNEEERDIGNEETDDLSGAMGGMHL